MPISNWHFFDACKDGSLLGISTNLQSVDTQINISQYLLNIIKWFCESYSMCYCKKLPNQFSNIGNFLLIVIQLSFYNVEKLTYVRVLKTIFRNNNRIELKDCFFPQTLFFIKTKSSTQERVPRKNCKNSHITFMQKMKVFRAYSKQSEL